MSSFLVLVSLLSSVLVDPAGPTPHATPLRATDGGCAHLPPAIGPRARANDNRAPGGRMHRDTLVLELVAARAAWRPEAEDGCAVSVLAFAEPGQPPSIPGSLVRVRAGTPVRVTVRNDAGATLWVRGLHDRPATAHAAVELAADSAREFRFTATTPGTYAYGATLEPFSAGGATVRPLRDDSQLLGALVVDSASAPATPRDRVLVLTRWSVPNPSDRGRPVLHAFTAVNGRSWPHTERLAYTVADTIHWRVINASAAGHPMHLHGFYFDVLAKGTVGADTVLARSRTMVTETLVPNETMRLRWVADRPGNWLFHCHLLVHMAPEQRLDDLDDSASAALGVGADGHRGVFRGSTVGRTASVNGGHHGRHGNHATDGMAGLIVGVLVHPAREQPAEAAHQDPPRRTLRLFANRRPPAMPGAAPRFGFVVQEGDREPARDSVRIPGSPIVLRRGEPVQITVLNRLTTPLSVHWHGLELESFFDGVGDWSGSAGSIAPPIAPGDSFVVRLAPPRAGTFMYHVHGEEGRELALGLYGPLVVVDGAPALDSLADRVLLVSDGGLRPQDGALVNGSRAPRITLTAGRTHRLRVIGITGTTAAEVAILSPAGPVSWQPLAIDGAEIVGGPEPAVPAVRLVRPGTIADFALTPDRPGELTLRVTVRRAPIDRTPGAVVDQWMAPIVVRPGPSDAPRPAGTPPTQ